MIDILILILINSAVCFGFWNACMYIPGKEELRVGSSSELYSETSEVKGVLWFIEKWASDKWFYKPLCGCLPCMASFHSIYPYWTYMYMTNALNWNALIFYPAYIMALSGVNYLIDRE